MKKYYFFVIMFLSLAFLIGCGGGGGGESSSSSSSSGGSSTSSSSSSGGTNESYIEFDFKGNSWLFDTSLYCSYSPETANKPHAFYVYATTKDKSYSCSMTFKDRLGDIDGGVLIRLSVYGQNHKMRIIMY